eukprot:gene4575-3272_t
METATEHEEPLPAAEEEGGIALDDEEEEEDVVQLSPDEVFEEAAELESTGLIVDAISTVKSYNDSVEARHHLHQEEHEEEEDDQDSVVEHDEDSTMVQVKNEVLRNFEILLSQHYFLTKLGLVEMHTSLFEWIQLSEQTRMDVFAQRLIHILLHSREATEVHNAIEVASKVLLMLPVEDFRLQLEEVFADHLAAVGIPWECWAETAAGRAGEPCAPSEDYEDRFCARFVDAMVDHLFEATATATDSDSAHSLYAAVEAFLLALFDRYHRDEAVAGAAGAAAATGTTTFLPLSYAVHLAVRTVVWRDDLFACATLIRRLFSLPNVLDEDERVGTLVTYLELAQFIDEHLPAPPLSVLFPQFAAAVSMETLTSLLFHRQQDEDEQRSERQQTLLRRIRLRRAQFAFEWEKLLRRSDALGPLLLTSLRLQQQTGGGKSLSLEVLLTALLLVHFVQRQLWSLKRVLLFPDGGGGGHLRFLITTLLATMVTAARWTTLVRLSLLWLDVGEVLALVQPPPPPPKQTQSPAKQPPSAAAAAAAGDAELIHFLFHFLFTLDAHGAHGAHGGGDTFRRFYFETLVTVLDAALTLSATTTAPPLQRLLQLFLVKVLPKRYHGDGLSLVHDRYAQEDAVSLSAADVAMGLAHVLFPTAATVPAAFQRPEQLLLHTWLVLVAACLRRSPETAAEDAAEDAATVEATLERLVAYATAHWPSAAAVPRSLAAPYQQLLRAAWQRRVAGGGDRWRYAAATQATECLGDVLRAQRHRRYDGDSGDSGDSAATATVASLLQAPPSSLAAVAFLPLELLVAGDGDGDGDACWATVEAALPAAIAAAATEVATEAATEAARCPLDALDAKIVARLVAQGYSDAGALRAAWATRGDGRFAAALSYAVAHAADAAFDHPFVLAPPPLRPAAASATATVARPTTIEARYRRQLLQKLATATATAAAAAATKGQRSRSLSWSAPALDAAVDAATVRSPVSPPATATDEWDSFGDSDSDSDDDGDVAEETVAPERAAATVATATVATEEATEEATVSVVGVEDAEPATSPATEPETVAVAVAVAVAADDAMDAAAATTAASVAEPSAAEEAQPAPDETPVAPPTAPLPSRELTRAERCQAALRALRRRDVVEAAAQRFLAATGDFAFHDADGDADADGDGDAAAAASWTVAALRSVLCHVADGDRWRAVVDVVVEVTGEGDGAVGRFLLDDVVRLSTATATATDGDGDGDEATPAALRRLFLSPQDTSPQWQRLRLRCGWTAWRLWTALQRVGGSGGGGSGESGVGDEATLCHALGDALLTAAAEGDADGGSGAAAWAAAWAAYVAVLAAAYDDTPRHALPRLKLLKQLAATAVDHYATTTATATAAAAALAAALGAAAAAGAAVDVEALRRSLAEDVALLRRLERLLPTTATATATVATSAADAPIDVKRALRSETLFPPRYFAAPGSGVDVDAVVDAVRALTPFLPPIASASASALAAWHVAVAKPFHHLVDASLLHFLVLCNQLAAYTAATTTTATGGGSSAGDWAFVALANDLLDTVLPKLSAAHLLVWSYLLLRWPRRQFAAAVARHDRDTGDTGRDTAPAPATTLQLALRLLPLDELTRHLRRLRASQRLALLRSLAAWLATTATVAGHSGGGGHGGHGHGGGVTLATLRERVLPFQLALLDASRALASPVDRVVRRRLRAVLRAAPPQPQRWAAAVAEPLRVAVAEALFDGGVATDGAVCASLLRLVRRAQRLFPPTATEAAAVAAVATETEPSAAETLAELWRWYAALWQRLLRQLADTVAGTVADTVAGTGAATTPPLDAPTLDATLEQLRGRVARLLHTGGHLFAAAAAAAAGDGGDGDGGGGARRWCRWVAGVAHRVLRSHVLAAWRRLDRDTDGAALCFACLDVVEALLGAAQRCATATETAAVASAAALWQQWQLFLRRLRDTCLVSWLALVGRVCGAAALQRAWTEDAPLCLWLAARVDAAGSASASSSSLRRLSHRPAASRRWVDARRGEWFRVAVAQLSAAGAGGGSGSGGGGGGGGLSATVLGPLTRRLRSEAASMTRLERRTEVLLLLWALLCPGDTGDAGDTAAMWTAPWLGEALAVLWAVEALPRGLFTAAAATQRLRQLVDVVLPSLTAQHEQPTAATAATAAATAVRLWSADVPRVVSRLQQLRLQLAV